MKDSSPICFASQPRERSRFHQHASFIPFHSISSHFVVQYPHCISIVYPLWLIFTLRFPWYTHIGDIPLFHDIHIKICMILPLSYQLSIIMIFPCYIHLLPWYSHDIPDSPSSHSIPSVLIWPPLEDIRVPFDLMAQDPRIEDPRNQDLKDFAKAWQVESWFCWLSDGFQWDLNGITNKNLTFH